jgi:uncharacterized OB-fold protein
MTTTAELKPAVSYLKYSTDGKPYLAGSKCRKCGETFLGDRDVCAKCGSRNQMEHKPLSDTGKLYNYTVVYRSFPGVQTPYVSAIVDLEGGGTVKGNLIEVEPDPKKLKFDMPVKVVYRDAGRKDKEGNSYLAYFFVPANKN